MSDSERTDAEGPVDDELPTDVVELAERLTRLERNAVDGRERDRYTERRDTVLGGYEFASRVREDDDGETLVLYPDGWVESGVICTDRIEDVSRAIEIPLDGPGDPDDWEELDARNRELVEAVRDRRGEVHGDNAAALADFMGNHRAKPIEKASADDLEEFRSEYFIRNAWPSEEQLAAIEESIEYVFETAGKPKPECNPD